MPGGNEIRAGNAYVEIALRNRLEAGLRRVASQLSTFARLSTTIGSGLTAGSAGILAPLAAAVTQFSGVGDAVEKMAARTGLSAEAVSELGHAADLSGTSIQTLESGFRRMQATVVDAASGLGSAQDALRALGLTAADLATLTPDEQFARIADAVASIEDPTHRAAAAMDVFGRGGTALLPLMADGAAGISSMRDQARQLGMTIDSDTAASAARLNDALGTLRSAAKAITLNLGAALAPTVSDLSERLTDVVGVVTRVVRANRPLIVTIARVAAITGAVGLGLIALGGAAALASLAVSGLATVIGAAGSVVAGVSAVLGVLLSPLGAVVGAVVTAAAAWLYLSDSGQAALAGLRRIVSGVRQIGGEIGAGLAAAVQAGDLSAAAQIAWRGLRVVWAAGAEQLSAVWQTVQTAAGSAWQQIRSRVAAAIVQIVSSGQSLTSRLIASWSRLTAGASAAWQTVQQGAQRAWRAVTQQISRGTTEIGRRVSQIPASLAAAMRRLNLDSPLRRTLSSLQQRAARVLSLLFASSPDAASRVVTTLRTVVSQGLGLLGRLATAGGRRLSGLISRTADIGRSVLATLTSITASVPGSFRGVSSSLMGLLTQAVVAGQSRLASLVQISSAFSGRLLSVLSSPLDLLRSLWDALHTAASTTLSSIVGTAGTLLGSLRSTISQTVTSIGSSVASLWQWIVSGVSTTATAVGSIASAIVSSLAAVGASVSSAFSAARGYTLETLAAIGASLASGDLALAAEIAWASLREVFARGAAWLSQTWSEVTVGLSMLFDRAITSIRTVWTRVSTWIGEGMLRLVGLIQDAVRRLADVDPTGLSQRLQQALDLDVDAAIRVLYEDSQRFTRSLEQSRQTRDDQRGAELLAQATAQQRRLAALRELRQQALDRVPDRQPDTSGESALQRSLRELRESIAAAVQSRTTQVADLQQRASQAATAAPGTISRLTDPGSTVGTFSAAIAGMLGRSGEAAGARTAEATEEMASTLSDLLDETRRRPTLAFE